MQKEKGLEQQELMDAIQQFELGVDYYKGRNGKKQDRSKAVVWYRKSAEQGYHKAQFSLGYCYNYGKGVTRDFIEAVEWYKKAVEQGNAYAQYNLGVCYNNGEGVVKDKKKAIALWEESAKNGYEVARITLERLKDIDPKDVNVNSSSPSKHYPIFISYKRVDKETVFSLKDKIEKVTGQNCWIDLDGIESDQQFANVIINAINNAEIVLFMYSKAHSLIEHYENDWTIRELNFAQEKGKRIVFVNIDKSPLTDWFRLMFGTKQQVDATSNLAINKLIEDLASWTEEKSNGNTTAIKEKQTRLLYNRLWGRFKLNRAIVLSFAFIALILFFIIFLFFSDGLVFHRMSTWKSRLSKYSFSELHVKELSTGKLYGMHEAVNLGLSVKWATCNIGAKAPEESGDFFAWGESYTKDYFDWRGYKYGECSYEKKDLKRYCTNSAYGVVDNLTVLCDSDDAACMAWGNGWRMPTYDEISELKENCKFEKKMVHGVNGVVVIGPNKKKIFIPFAGDVEGDKHIPNGENTYAILWSSSLNEENDYAYEFAFSVADNLWYRGLRFTGHNIRAVHE